MNYLQASWAILLLAAPLSFAAAEDKQPPRNKGQSSSYLSLPEWLSLGGSLRMRTERRHGIGFREESTDSYGLTRLRFHLGLKPRPWINLYLEGQDSRAPGIRPLGPLARDPLDLRQANVEFELPFQPKVVLKVGRQELRYGSQRLISPANWSNLSRTFDAAKLSVGGGDNRFDLFAASVVRIDADAFNKLRDGENLYGFYGWVKPSSSKVVLEPFFFYRTRPFVQGGLNGSGSERLYTAGVRFERTFPSGFDSYLKAARQFGSLAGDRISSWSTAMVWGYRRSLFPLKPRFSLEYARASGDPEPLDGVRRTFDPLYPTAHAFLGIADTASWRNIQNIKPALELELAPKVKLRLDHYWLWLASSRDHFYGPTGAIAVRAPQGGAASSKVGRELDLILTYQLWTNTSVEGGWGHLFPGPFLRVNSPGSANSFFYLSWHSSF